MSEQASNETISETNPTDSSMTNKISELVDYVLSKVITSFWTYYGNMYNNSWDYNNDILYNQKAKAKRDS